MLEKTDSDLDLLENYEINEPSTKELLKQDLKDPSSKVVSQDFVKDIKQNLVVDLEENLGVDLKESLEENLGEVLSEESRENLQKDLSNNLHQGLSEELIKELEKESSETLEQSMLHDLANKNSGNKDLSNEFFANEHLINEGLSNEYLSKSLSNSSEDNMLNDSFNHYKKYTSQKPRSRFFNWSISLAKLCLFMMLLPIIIFIISMLGGALLTLLGMGIGLIAASFASLAFMAFYISSLTKSIVLLLIALSVTFFSFGLFILLVGFIIFKKFIMLIVNYYKSKREAKEARVL